MSLTQSTVQINGYGTIAGLILSSFFAMLIVLYKPDQSAWYSAYSVPAAHLAQADLVSVAVMGQLAVAHMYLVGRWSREVEHSRRG